VTDGWDEARGRIVSYTHEKNLAPPQRNGLLVVEDVRKPEQTSSIACCALWKYNNGALCSSSYFIQTLVPLLVVGGLEGDPPRVGEYKPK